MTLPDFLQIQQATGVIVRQAHQHERSLTPRMIRSEVELCFSLEPGTLDSEEYKRSLKRAIESAVLSLDQELGDCSVATTESLPKKGPVSEQSRKGARLSATIVQGRHRQTVKRKRDDHVKEYKSAAIISSDTEDEFESTSHKDPNPQRLEETLMEPHDRHDFLPHKRPSIQQVNDQAQETAFKVMENNITKSEPRTPAAVDEVPRQKKKPKTVNNELQGKSGQKKKSKETTSGTSKDEATIKRLKSFVVACGVRKIWSRVFENIEAPAQQIKKLREILAELGMTGRLSLERAKRIKEKRELAEELEDVQSFQQSVVARGSRFRKALIPDDVEMESDVATDESEAATVLVPRKRTAFQSIAAFLEDQSDNE